MPTRKPAEGNVVLGIDVGTSSTKAALFDLSDPARPRAIARRSSETFSSRPGWSETDASALLGAVFDCVREVIAAADGAVISAIGISGTACGAWLLDGENTLVRPPILWNDGRAADILRDWSNSGLISRSSTGLATFPSAATQCRSSSGSPRTSPRF
jgi:sugar (pentulose or hexulose) kinase